MCDKRATFIMTVPCAKSSNMKYAWKSEQVRRKFPTSNKLQIVMRNVVHI